MSQPFISEIRVFTFAFAPKGWALCDGTLMTLDQNKALFSLIGTTYGGDGVKTFALPDLRGRIPLHVGQGYALGQVSGEENHTLIASEMPAHTHPIMGQTADANQSSPVGNTWGASDLNPYARGGQNAPLHGDSLSHSGADKPHPNIPPYLVFNFCIALTGSYPSKT